MGATMSNGNRIIVLRILASTVISLAALICAAWLMEKGIELPSAFWMIAVLAVGGVAGADIVTAILHSRNAMPGDDS